MVTIRKNNIGGRAVVNTLGIPYMVKYIIGSGVIISKW